MAQLTLFRDHKRQVWAATICEPRLVTFSSSLELDPCSIDANVKTLLWGWPAGPVSGSYMYKLSRTYCLANFLSQKWVATVSTWNFAGNQFLLSNICLFYAYKLMILGPAINFSIETSTCTYPWVYSSASGFLWIICLIRSGGFWLFFFARSHLSSLVIPVRKEGPISQSEATLPNTIQYASLNTYAWRHNSDSKWGYMGARPPSLTVAAPIASFWVSIVTYLMHIY